MDEWLLLVNLILMDELGICLDEACRKKQLEQAYYNRVQAIEFARKVIEEELCPRQKNCQ